jgi:hypothetical protein
MFSTQLEVVNDHHVADIQWVNIDEIKKLDSLPGMDEIVEIVKKNL